MENEIENVEDIEKNIKEIEDIKEELKPDSKMIELIRMVMNETSEKEREQKENTEQKDKIIAKIGRYIKIKDRENLRLKSKEKLEKQLIILQSIAFKRDPQTSFLEEIKQNKLYLLYITVLTALSFAIGVIFHTLGA